MQSIVRFRQAGFSYGKGKSRVQALLPLDFEAFPGQVWGLLGPNGAGKTTFIRCAAGLLAPDPGSVELFGAHPQREALGRVGVVIEHPGLYRRLSAFEYLRFFCRIYGLERPEKRIRQLAGDFGISLTPGPVGKLSMGQKQKLQLVRSLLHAPSLLLWDEPFSSLDPQAQACCGMYLKEYAAKSGAAAVVATHQLRQAEEVCTDYVFIKQGRVLFSGSRESIDKESAPFTRMAFGFSEPADSAVLESTARRYALELSARTSGGPILQADFSGPGMAEKVPSLVNELSSCGCRILSAVPEQVTLGTFYHKVMEQET